MHYVFILQVNKHLVNEQTDLIFYGNLIKTKYRSYKLECTNGCTLKKTAQKYKKKKDVFNAW